MKQRRFISSCYSARTINTGKLANVQLEHDTPKKFKLEMIQFFDSFNPWSMSFLGRRYSSKYNAKIRKTSATKTICFFVLSTDNLLRLTKCYFHHIRVRYTYFVGTQLYLHKLKNYNFKVPDSTHCVSLYVAYTIFSSHNKWRKMNRLKVFLSSL